MMNRKIALICAAMSAVATCLAAPPPPPTYVPGEVLVKYQPGQETAGRLLAASLGANVKMEIPRLGVELLKLPNNITTPQAIAALDSNAAVAYAEPNYRQKWFDQPNDPRLGQQYGASQMKLSGAWDFTHGDPTVLIAIIDSGMDTNHPDLAGNFAFGKDYVDGDNTPNPTQAHGTHVTGIAAAVTNNGLGVAGMGYNCKYIGISHDLTVATSAAAMIWASDNGAKVINMSYGYIGPETETESDAVDYAWDKGVLLVAAAGNSNYGGTDSYPNGYEKVISVGATGINGQKVGFSDWGPRVDVAAPGDNIISTWWPGNGYAAIGGTSMSSPGVCGVAGLLFSYGGPGVTNAEVRSAIESTTVSIGNWLQFGRVDAAAAMAVIRPLVDVITTPGTVTTNEGVFASGSAANVGTPDDAYYAINTVNVPSTGAVASAIAEFTVNFDVTKLRGSKLYVEAKGINLATNFLYFWNGTRWVSFRQFPLRATDNSLTVNMGQSVKNYIKNGKIKVLSRASIAPRRGATPFLYQIDAIRFENKVQS